MPTRRRTRDDRGFTLVEMLVAMTTLLIIVVSFSFLYYSFQTLGFNTTGYAEAQGTERTVIRILEADARSADPLTLVPATFTQDPAGARNSDVIGMFEQVDTYATSPSGGGVCPGGGTTTVATTTSLPAPFASGNVIANVVWAYDPTAGTVTRYSWCTSTNGWRADDVVLKGVSNASGTMFKFVAPSSSATSQITTPPTSTSNPNSAAPACAASLDVLVTTKTVKGGFPFTVQVNVVLPNQPGVLAQGCA